MSQVPMIASPSHALAQARQAELTRVATAHRHAGPGRARRMVSPGNVAFLCLFAAQAGVLTLSPILPSVACEFGISTAAAGQLRTLAGLSGGIAALAVVLVGARVGLRRLLLAGNGLLALGSTASAAAPTLSALAVSQMVVGAATGLLISGGLAAAATWAPADRQTQTVAWASLGQPASWVAGMPLIGMTADLGWRYTWLGVPLAAGLAGLAAVHSRPADQRAATPAPRVNSLRWDPKLAGWTLGELLGYAGWGGVLVYAGALLVESYHAAPATVGLLLGTAAIAAFPGNFLVRRWLSGSARELLIVLGLSAAAITAVFGTVRPGLLLSTATFTLLVLVATTRTVAGSAFALYVSPERRLAVMGVRASTAQIGYLLGGAAGGAALAAGGYPALGLTLAALFALGTTPHIRTLLAERAGQRHTGSRGFGSRPPAQHGADALGLTRVARLAGQRQAGPRVVGRRAPQMCGDRNQKDRSDVRGVARAESAATAIHSKNGMPPIHQRVRDGFDKDVAKPGSKRGRIALPALQSRPTDETP
jgi:predicted MFS family arabinose efflux permease